MRLPYFLALGLALSLAAAGASVAEPAPDGSAGAANGQPASSVTAGQDAPIGVEIARRALSPTAKIADDAPGDWQALEAFYASRGDDTLWVASNGLTAKGLAAIEEIKKAADWGLRSEDFDVPALAAASAGGPELPRDQRAGAEMQLSLAVLMYARYARGGRVTEPAKQLSSYLDRTPQYRDPKTVLDEFAAADDPAAVLRGLHPKHPQFEKLRQKYLEMSKAAGAASVVVRIPKGPKLMPGERHDHVALLRRRLAPESGATPDDAVYDAALVEAVKKFQTGKGMRADGIVGSSTRDALNDIETPSPMKLLANMEEWRWMPEDMGATYVWVNVPEFMIRVVKDGNVIHEERVVTGQVEKQTPIFSDRMETIYFHPRWNVPESIKVLELYPGLIRGGDSFGRQGLRLMRNGRQIDPYEVDWSRSDIRNFDVYQPSGPGNVLGVVKFAFPNKHGVYMHDTTSKSLFNEPSRPFSHGCMRVRDPLRLAELLLSADKGWDRNRIDNIIDSEPDETAVLLDKPVPVHITYFTAWIDDNGTEHDFKDVYGHEQRLTLALQGKFSQIVRGPDHLAPVHFDRSKYADTADDWGFFFGGGAGGPNRRYKQSNTPLNDFMNNIFGGF